MAKTYLATKSEVTAVAGDVTTINTQLNTATTGIDARVTALELSGTGAVVFRNYSPTGKYAAGEVVLFGGALFSANSVMDGTVTPIVFNESAAFSDWTRTGGSTPLGAIVPWEGVKYGLAVPDGYALCDGAIINFPGSLLHGFNAPDHRGRALAAANGGTYVADTIAGLDSRTLVRANLPNVTLSGTTGGGGTHSHTIPQLSFATYTSTDPATSSAYPYALATPAVWVLDSEIGGDITGTTRKYLAFSSTTADYTLSDTNHSHYVSGSTNQSTTLTVGDHTHTFTTSSVNGNVTQTAVDMRQATRYVTTLIKL